MTHDKGDALASTVHVFPEMGVVPVLSKACTEKVFAGPTVVPLAAAPVTVAVTVVFPETSVETVGAPGDAGRHNAYRVTFE